MVGRSSAVRRRRPYVARLPLASPARVQTVRAVALDKEGRAQSVFFLPPGITGIAGMRLYFTFFIELYTVKDNKTSSIICITCHK